MFLLFFINDKPSIINIVVPMIIKNNNPSSKDGFFSHSGML